MPIYAYRCGDCHFEKDHLQKLSDAPIGSCPSCGSNSYAKQLTAAGFQLKGNGWYATDFKGGGGSSKPATETKPESTASEASNTASTPCGTSCACH